MNKFIKLSFCMVAFPFSAFCQNVGIGTATPTKALLEVHGVEDAGRTSGLFGGSSGISLQRNIPAIGFNQYRDDSLNTNNGRYAGTGYAATMSYVYNDASMSTGFDINIYPFGNADALIPSGIRPLRLTNNARTSIMTDGNAMLEVGRSNGFEGTAMFQGTNYNSHFNYSATENTYIRPGKSGDVIINDIVGGKVIFGETATRVGLNTSTPVYPLEIRQVAGTGIRMANASYISQNWEWRVSGSPTNFYAYYAGAIRTYFSPTNGSLNPISDERLKQNIKPMPKVLDRLLQLKPVTYEMIHDNPNHQRSMGFIAQEVQPLFPQLTFAGNNNTDTMALQYSVFGVVAIKAIQEEEQLILEIDKKTQEAERRMAEIEKRIAALKAKKK